MESKSQGAPKRRGVATGPEMWLPTKPPRKLRRTAPRSADNVLLLCSSQNKIKKVTFGELPKEADILRNTNEWVKMATWKCPGIKVSGEKSVSSRVNT